MQEYIVECVRLKDRIGKGQAKIPAESPREAIETFIHLYLKPIDEPQIYYGGLDYEAEKYLSYKVKFKERDDIVFFLNCRYLGEKGKYAKTLP